MVGINLFIRLSWVLAVALLAPVALPAGGGDFHQPEIRRRGSFGPLLAGKRCALRTSPLAIAPILRTLEIGTPIEPLRYWKSGDGKSWLQVKVTFAEAMELHSSVRRGWVNL